MKPAAAHLATILAISLSIPPATAEETDDRIYYGSRAGMHLTTVSKDGIGTANAIIRVEHTAKDAKAFCVEYEQDFTMACVKRAMTQLKGVGDRVTGNCVERNWRDMFGRSFAFLGTAKSDEVMADYAIKDVATGEILDGSSASGYDVQLTIFQQLCPGIAQ